MPRRGPTGAPGRVEPLFGRHVEVKNLTEALGQAKDGLGSVRVVLGPSGIGKTHLLESAISLASELGFEVRRAFTMEGWTAPFFVLEQLLPPSSSTTGAEPGDPSGLPSLLAMAATSDGSKETGRSGGPPRAIRVVPAPVEPTEEGQLLPLGISAAIARTPVPESTALLGYLRRLEEASQQRPQLLVVDDLQWCDGTSLQGLRFLARNAARLPVALLLAGRREGRGTASAPGGTGPLSGLLDDLERAQKSAIVRLAPLAPSPAHRLVESVLGGALATPVDARPFRLLLGRAGGNPLVLAETVRELERDGFARRERGRWMIAAPSTWEGGRSGAARSAPSIGPVLAQVLLSRVAELPAGLREVLGTAAVLGERFDLEPVAGATGQRPSELRRELQPLFESGGLLTEGVGPGGRIAFAHGLLWEALSESMSADQRRGRAARLGSWYLAHRPAEGATVARLLVEAGDDERAAPAIRQAMTDAVAAQDLEGLERLDGWYGEVQSRRGVEAIASVRERLPMVERLVRSQGTNPVTRRLLLSLLESAPPSLERWALEAHLASIEAVRAPREGRALLERLSREMSAAGGPTVPPYLRARVAVTWANLLIREGNVPKALEKGQEALPLVEGIADRWEAGRAYYVVGWCLGFLERQPEAQAALHQALEIARSLDDARLLGLSLELRGMLANLRGAAPEAHAATIEALEQYRRAGSVNNTVLTLGNLAMVESDLGDVERAWGRTEEMLALARRFDLKRGIGLASLRQGDILALTGRPSEARARYAEAIEVYRELGDRESLAPCLLKLARAEAQTGSVAAARRRVDEVVGGHHGSLAPSDRYLTAWARTAIRAAVGTPAETRKEFEEARELAHESRNPYNEADVLHAQAAWERRIGSPDGTVRALESAAEQLWRSCGIDPRRLAEARLWTGPAPPTRGPVARSPGRRRRAARPEGKAPLAQKILLHLAGHQVSVPEGSERAPEALSQPGLSRGLGLPQARFAKTLARLQERGLVVSEVRPVEGHGRRLKVYRATPAGLAMAQELQVAS